MQWNQVNRRANFYNCGGGKPGLSSVVNSKLATFVIRRFYISISFSYSLFKTPEVGLSLPWNSAKAEYFKNKKNFMLRKPD